MVDFLSGALYKKDGLIKSNGARSKVQGLRENRIPYTQTLYWNIFDLIFELNRHAPPFGAWHHEAWK